MGHFILKLRQQAGGPGVVTVSHSPDQNDDGMSVGLWLAQWRQRQELLGEKASYG